MQYDFVRLPPNDNVVVVIAIVHNRYYRVVLFRIPFESRTNVGECEYSRARSFPFSEPSDERSLRGGNRRESVVVPPLHVRNAIVRTERVHFVRIEIERKKKEKKNETGLIDEKYTSNGVGPRRCGSII